MPKIIDPRRTRRRFRQEDDPDLVRMDDGQLSELEIGLLPNCPGPRPTGTMLVMTDSRFPAAPRVAAGLLSLLMLALRAGCASPSAQAGDPPLAQVTAARALSRPVTEWNEFTGRLEAVHHVDIRP